MGTTLSYVTFTDSESIIGDALRIQRTPRLMPAACSLTRIWSVCFRLRAAAFTGSEHLIGTHCEAREHCVDASRSLLFLGDGVALNSLTTLGLSPSRTPIEFGLAGVSCFPRASWTLQWT